jgi:hypothetical protein
MGPLAKELCGLLLKISLVVTAVGCYETIKKLIFFRVVKIVKNAQKYQNCQNCQDSLKD